MKLLDHGDTTEVSRERSDQLEGGISAVLGLSSHSDAPVDIYERADYDFFPGSPSRHSGSVMAVELAMQLSSDGCERGAENMHQMVAQMLQISPDVCAKKSESTCLVVFENKAILPWMSGDDPR